jgi:flagellar hook-associated protein 2
MAGIQITGLASGLDWQNIINELITADKAPETQWTAEQTTDQNQVSALATLNSDLTAFQTAADSMGTGDTFDATTATVGDPSSGWSASASPGTNLGQYSFDVTKLASTSVLSGAANVGAHLSASSDVNGVTIGTMNVATPVTPGVFTINGAQVTVTQSESLQDVFSAIATATNNAVTASYDPTSDTVQLSSSSAITLGAENDTSNFLSAMGLYNNSTDPDTITSANALGSVGLNATIADSGLSQAITDVDSSGNGSFAINGVTINFNVNTDTIQNILADINDSSAGVTATFNGANSQFTLTNNSTGDTGISVSEASGGLLAAMGLNGTGATLTQGENAQFSIDGSGPFTSATNNLDASVDGINGLTVNATSLGTQTVTVATDTSGISTSINNLISAYNTVQTYITAETQITNNDGTVTTSTLSGNQDVVNMQADLQNLMFNSIPGLTGGITSLDNIGIGFTGTSPLLSIQDQTTLNNAIQNNPSQVAALFTNLPNGLVAQIDNYVTNATGPNGPITAATTALNQDSNNLETQINNLNTQLTAEQQQLTTEFTNMETAESTYQTEETTLNSILNGGSASSSSSSSSSPSSNESTANANASSSTATGSTSSA